MTWPRRWPRDRKSTRLNSSHLVISYAVFCLKKKTVLAVRLREQGVDTRPFFVGMHEQPVFRARGLFTGERYPVTERISRRGLYLPSGLGLQESEIHAVCAALRNCLA